MCPLLNFFPWLPDLPFTYLYCIDRHDFLSSHDWCVHIVVGGRVNSSKVGVPLKCHKCHRHQAGHPITLYRHRAQYRLYPDLIPGSPVFEIRIKLLVFRSLIKKLRNFYLSVPNNWWSREGVYRPECIFPLKYPEWFMRFHYNETETFTAMWSLYCASILAPMLYCVIFKHKIRKFWISLYYRCPILNRGWVIQGRSLFFQQGGFLLPLIYTRLLVEKFSSQVFKKCNQNKEEPHLLIACKDFESSVKRRFQFLHGLSTI